MFDNVLPTDAAGVLMFRGTSSHWYDLTSLWYDLVAFTALALWAAFRTTSRTWSLSPVQEHLDHTTGKLK